MTSRLLSGLTCLVAGASAAALSNVRARDATNNPRYDIISGTPSNCVWWWNSDDGLSCSLMLMVVGVAEDDFVSWNPSITSGCGNYEPDHSYCIKVDESGSPDPSPTDDEGSPEPTPTDPEPTPTDPEPTEGPGNGIETPSPIQPGMVDDCDEFHFVEKGQGCEEIALEYGISLQEFNDWNTEVGLSCGGLWAEVNVCVSIIGHESEPTPTDPDNGIETPSPIQPGMVDDCDEFHFVEKGEGCESIADEWGISMDQFITWNPEVGGLSCGGLWAEVNVCVSIIGHESDPSPTDPGNDNGIETPSPVRENMVDNCDDFHFVESGDSCQTIADEANIELNLFYRWNPDAGDNCGGLWLDTYVCVSTTNHTPSPTDPGNGIETPTPIQDGMTGNCNRFHFVEKGDLCVDLADEYNIRVSDIIRWNPAAGDECRGLWGNTYACVGVL